jgi:hypothetical protein
MDEKDAEIKREIEMGVYVNPQDMSKEDWLALHGQILLDPPKWEDIEDIEEGKLPVCLVDNGPFKAAGVAFAKRELDEFTRPDDPRPKTWFMVSIKDLGEVSPIAEVLQFERQR